MISSNTRVKVRYEEASIIMEVEGFYNYLKDGILHLKDISGLERIMSMSRIIFIDEIKSLPPKESVK